MPNGTLLLAGLTIVLAFVSGLAGLHTPCGLNALISVTRPQRERPDGRSLRLLAFGAGLIVGSGLLGGILIGLGYIVASLPGDARLVPLLTAAFVGSVYCGALLLGIRLRVPTRRWLVPRSWYGLGEVRFAFQFGIALGLGLLTIVSFAGFYVLLLLLLGMSPGIVVLAMLAFATGRWVLTAAASSATSMSLSHGYRVDPPRMVAGVNRIQGAVFAVSHGVLAIVALTVLVEQFI